MSHINLGRFPKRDILKKIFPFSNVLLKPISASHTIQEWINLVGSTYCLTGADPHRFPPFYGNRSDVS